MIARFTRNKKMTVIAQIERNLSITVRNVYHVCHQTGGTWLHDHACTILQEHKIIVNQFKYEVLNDFTL